MPTAMLHDDAARKALGRGVALLAKAVRGTLGPKGMNVVIDRPIGMPVVSRDGVFVAGEVELEDPFENMGAQVLRDAVRKTNEVVGDGTTTATILANAMVQAGLAAIDGAGSASCRRARSANSCGDGPATAAPGAWPFGIHTGGR